ncbi:MAG TPA: hypothetical protein PKY28_09495, partial [Ferruginibacter sp.]|nr:hypothetical protein [Ferruginibacter sp.]
SVVPVSVLPPPQAATNAPKKRRIANFFMLLFFCFKFRDTRLHAYWGKFYALNHTRLKSNFTDDQVPVKLLVKGFPGKLSRCLAITYDLNHIKSCN